MNFEKNCYSARLNKTFILYNICFIYLFVPLTILIMAYIFIFIFINVYGCLGKEVSRILFVYYLLLFYWAIFYSIQLYCIVLY